MTLATHSLWRNRAFMCLWTAQTLSEFGAKIGLVAIPLIGAVVLHATPFQMGALAAAETLPYLLLGLVAGSWVDQLSKRIVMVAADLARAAVLTLVPMLAWLGVLSIEILCALAFLIGTAEVWFNIASAAYTPIVVGKEALIDANSKLALSSSGAEAVGPATAGVLIQLASAPIALLGNALTYVLSAVLVRASAQTDDRPAQRSANNHASLADSIRTGLQFVFTSELLRAVTLRLAAWQFVVGTGNALLVYFAVQELGLSSAVVGGLFSVMGAGVLAGALIVRPLSDRLGIGRSIMFAVPTAATFALLIPFASGPPFWRGAMVACALFVYGLSSTVYEVNNVTLRQSVTPREMLGRMTSTVRVSTLGLRPLGALLGGALGGTIGIRETLTAVVSAGLVLSLVSLFVSPLRKIAHRHQLGELPVER